MKKLIIMAVCAAFTGAGNAQTGEIRGTITNQLKEPVAYATIRVLQASHLVGGAQTDENGVYSCKGLIPGHYELLVSEAGHVSQPVRGIKVVANEASYVDVKLQPNVIGTVVVVADPYDYSPAGVDRNMYSMLSLDAKDLNSIASYNPGNIEGILSSVSSDVTEGPGGGVHVRGARGGATGFYVDGVRTLNAAIVPGHSIENITVFTGGVPAMFGDLMSGAVFITTKSYFSAMRERNMRQSYANPE